MPELEIQVSGLPFLVVDTTELLHAFFINVQSSFHMTTKQWAIIFISVHCVSEGYTKIGKESDNLSN